MGNGQLHIFHCADRIVPFFPVNHFQHRCGNLFLPQSRYGGNSRRHLLRNRFFQRTEHGLRDLERTRGRDNQGLSIFSMLIIVLVSHKFCDCRMGIQNIACLFIGLKSADTAFSILRGTAIEESCQLPFHIHGNLIPSSLL